MRPYTPFRDAVAFTLRRTAFIDRGAGPGSFLADDGADYAIGERVADGTVRGLVYSVYGTRDHGEEFHITDEATPRAIRAYAARIARGRAIHDDIPDGQGGEVVPTPALIAWERYRHTISGEAGLSAADPDALYAKAIRLMEPNFEANHGDIRPGGVAFYASGAPWRFVHKVRQPYPLSGAWIAPDGAERAFPGLSEALAPWRAP